MLRKGLSIVLLLGFTLAPGLVSSQELPPGKWWKNPGIVKKLDLEEKQIEQLEAAFVESARKLIGLKSKVQKEQFEFRVLLNGKDLNETAVMKQLKRLDKERSALNAERVRMLLKTRQIIGYDNSVILREHLERRTKQKIRRFTGREGQRKGKWKSRHGKSEPDM